MDLEEVGRGHDKMADAYHKLCDSPRTIENISVSGASDRQYCEQLKSENQVLHKEVKSLTEIVNLLNEELKTVCQSNEVGKLSTTHADKGKISLTSCRNCVLLESKLQMVTSEISSLKLIIDLLNSDNRSSMQSYQENPKADNICVTADQGISSGINSYYQPKTVHCSQDAANQDKFAIPTSNRFAALSNYSDQQLNEPSFTSYPAITPRNYSRKSATNTVKTYLKKTSPMTRINGHPVRQPGNHKLQKLRNEKEVQTIPTIVNGVTMKTNLKYNSEISGSPTDPINDRIDDLHVTINEYKKSVHLNADMHRVVVIGDSHIKGFENLL
jgi:hypothetical protein